ncbi:hypothetical protein ACNKHV_16985 [Shigella flexneri]
MGENGALWGGECLRVNYRECQHLGGLPGWRFRSRFGSEAPWRTCWRSACALCRSGRITLKQQVWTQNSSVLARAIPAELRAAGVIVWAFFRCSGGGTGLCASHVKL